MSILASLAAEFASYYKAILARSMFGMHALVAVWRTTVLMGVVYWSLALGVVMLVAEYIVTMWVRMGEEWPWISPSTLCYLVTAAASLWVQKLESLGHIKAINGTFIATLPSTGMQMDFSAADWLLLTEQTMMVTIILSRWLLPKGTMSHKDLSSLLLLYLALSADILDFSTIFNEATVVRDKTFCYVILVVWTGSLVQFTLVLTNTSTVDKEDTRITLKSIICSSEIWQIIVQIGLQDLPFLLIRVLALVQYQVFNFTIIFFVCKNSLVIALEMYHLVATCVEQQRKLKKRKERMKHLKSKMVSVKDAVGLGKLSNLTRALKAGGGVGSGGGGGVGNNGKDGGSGNGEANRNQNNTLALIAANIAKSKSEKDDGKRKESDIEGKDQTCFPTENRTSSTSPILRKDEKNRSTQRTNKLSQNLLLSTLKKSVKKDVNFNDEDHRTSNSNETSEGLPRTGSQLANENNFSAVRVLKNQKQTTNDAAVDGIGTTFTTSTPPLSHLRIVQNVKGNERLSPMLRNHSNADDPRANDTKTRSTIFDDDDSIF